MTRARKALIVRTSAVSETAPSASVIGDGLQAVATAFDRLTGVMAYLAALEHSETAGEQRQLAAVIYQTAAKRFGGVKYDGQPIDQATIDQLDAMWAKFFNVDIKKLRGRR